MTNNNSILRRLKAALGTDNTEMLKIFKQADIEMDESTLTGFLKKEDETGYASCSEDLIKHFLNGLIFLKRGKKDENPEQKQKSESPLNNNIILKKLRIALQLQEKDLLKIFSTEGLNLSASELSALFRASGNKHFRECSDDMFNIFLQGLKKIV